MYFTVKAGVRDKAPARTKGLLVLPDPRISDIHLKEIKYVKSGFSGSQGWYQMTSKGIWHLLLIWWVKKRAKVGLKSNIFKLHCNFSTENPKHCKCLEKLRPAQATLKP